MGTKIQISHNQVQDNISKPCQLFPTANNEYINAQLKAHFRLNLTSQSVWQAASSLLRSWTRHPLCTDSILYNSCIAADSNLEDDIWAIAWTCDQACWSLLTHSQTRMQTLMHGTSCRAGHLAFAVLECCSKSYCQANLDIKITYFWARPFEINYHESKAHNSESKPILFSLHSKPLKVS